MRIAVLSPNIKVLFSPEQIAQLNSLGSTVLIEEIKPLEQTLDLIGGGGGKKK